MGVAELCCDEAISILMKAVIVPVLVKMGLYYPFSTMSWTSSAIRVVSSLPSLLMARDMRDSARELVESGFFKNAE